MNKGKWSDKEVEILKQYYSTISDLSKIPLNRKLRSIYTKARALGLKRVKNKGHENLLKSGKPFRFKKSHVPFNKGKLWKDYMPEESQKRVLKTGFKKGNIPHTFKHEGKPYFKERKSRKEKNWFIHKPGDKRRNYLRVLWEEKKGKIPKNHVIRFKGKFIENRVPVTDDLICVHRKDLLNSNTGVHDVTEKYARTQLKKRGISNPSKELIELERNYILLNRKINNNNEKD